MRLGGLNTYDPVQIQNHESKFNLNCYNKDGVLVGKDYTIPFNIPATEVYRREYVSNGYANTSTIGLVDTPPFYTSDDDPTKRISGLVKPNCSLYVDTVKFDNEVNGNYCRKIEEFANDYFFTNGSGGFAPVVSKELLSAVKSFASNCEVYRDVEVAVSYSGAYGESGLTKFRLTSTTLHFFTIVHGIDRYRNDPNYKYVNVYVKYGAYTDLQLLYKIKIADLIDSRYKSITIKTDSADPLMYSTYAKSDLYIRSGINPNVLHKVDTIEDSNMIDDASTVSSIIYSGLFQFDDDTLINPSWFVAQKLSPILPLADVETHTFISTEEYDIEERVSTFMDDKYTLDDTIAATYNNTPLLTYDSSIVEYTDGDYSVSDDDRWNDTFKISTRQWTESNPGVEQYITGRIIDEVGTMSLYSYGVHPGQQPNMSGLWYDLYDKAFLNLSDVYGKRPEWGTGTLIIQYWASDTNGRILSTHTPISYSHVSHITLQFGDILPKLADGFDWYIDIWFNPASESGESSTDNYYRIASVNVNDAYTEYLSLVNGGNSTYTDIPTVDDDRDLALKSLGLTHRAILSDVKQIGNDTSGRKVYSMRDYGFAQNAQSGDTTFFIVAHPSFIMDAVDEYHTYVYGEESLSGTEADNAFLIDSPLNYTDDISNVFYNLEGRFDRSYSTYANGIRSTPSQIFPVWRIEVRHMEQYDNRLWYCSREIKDDTADYTINCIVSYLYTQEPNAYYIVRESGKDDTLVYFGENGSITKTIPVTDETVVYNLADENYYKFREDSLYDSKFELYTPHESDYKDLYHSQQGYPEMVLETNYRGYPNRIVGLKSFSSNLYVFCKDEINVIRKTLGREDTGIIEPTYQYDKVLDSGCIEWTIAEFEKKLYFTNSNGIYYIDSSGAFTRVSNNIDKLFTDGYITEESVDFADMLGDFYVIKLIKTIPFSVFSKLDIHPTVSGSLYCEYIAYHTKTDTFWMGNGATSSNQWFYMTKDFEQRNKYENMFLMKQMKRVSFSYSGGQIKVTQIRNEVMPVGLFVAEASAYNMPVRHTLKGYRNSTYSLLIAADNTVEMRDFMMIENGK